MKQLALVFCVILSWASLGQAQITLIPDTAFEAALIELGYDTLPVDGSVPTSNIESLWKVVLINKGISDLTGIEDFAALEELTVDKNNLTTSHSVYVYKD